MTTHATETWAMANQRTLLGELAEIRALLDRHSERGRGRSMVSTQGSREAAVAPGSALDIVCSRFRLTPFERDVLLLCAGVELDGAFPAACAAAQGDPLRTYATFGLALAVLPGAHWSALAPHAPLRHWRLVAPATGMPLATAPLRIDEHVLHFLVGVEGDDELLAVLTEPLSWPVPMAASHAALAARVSQAWGAADEEAVVQLCGPDPAARRAVAAAVAAELGTRARAVGAAVLPTAADELDGLARLCDRHAALGGGLLVVDLEDVEATDAARAAVVGRLVGRMHAPVVVSARERRRTGTRPSLMFDVPAPSTDEQRRLWAAALGPGRDDDIDRILGHFAFGAADITAATATAQASGLDLWDACRAQARAELEGVAQRIDTRAGWDDLVLPAEQMETLRAVVAHARRRALVYESWGFDRRSTTGMGISALFAGASGTGKTLAAEVIAHELGLDLYRVDLSQVVSKYIGETEKNLRRVFDAAEAGAAVLLFDEADALFGKRSEVKDSHDRYANIEVSYLLQRMETYRGLAVLTTNQKSALDTAFLRRLRFVVTFPFPAAAEREAIWRRVFPPETPTDGLDHARLARLTVAGGNIRNIALNGAFLAADEGQPVRMAHLLRAARAEYDKLEKPLTEAEAGAGGWV